MGGPPRLRPVTIAAVMCATASVLFAVGVAAAPGSGGKCRGHLVTIEGSSDGERLVGTARRDVILGGGGADVILGRDGDDVVCGGRGADVIRGAAGDDVLGGDRGSDSAFGGSGIDTCAAESTR